MIYKQDHLFFLFAQLLILYLEQKGFLLILLKCICVRDQLFFGIYRIGPSINARGVVGWFREELVLGYGRKIRISRGVAGVCWEETVNLVWNYDRKINHIFHGIYERSVCRNWRR